MEIILDLEEHGWLDVIISTKQGNEIHIPVSFLSDAVYDIASRMSVLDTNYTDITIVLQTEPGEYRLRITKKSEKSCLFEVFEMDDNFSSEYTHEGNLLLVEEVKTIRLIRMIYRELSKMKELGLEEFKRRWNYDFPLGYYIRMSEAIKNLKSIEADSM